MLIRVNISADISFECSNLNLCTSASSKNLKNKFDVRQHTGLSLRHIKA